MCGIAAWGGKNPKDFDLHKLGTLGIFNEKRGTHSCGLTTDFKIAVGIDEHKVFKDFMTTEGFKAPKKHPFAIAHTRKATGGAHNKYNAHPFGFGEGTVEKGKFSFVGVHNGSLLNEHNLAVSYEINPNGLKDDKTSRKKIDSEILLECIYKSKSFKVLSEYNGAAALVFANIEEPNVLYVFRGASKSKQHDLEEERPLYYWREKMNSLYISSMKNSLEAIAITKAAKKNIHAFECNTVYKITNGDINKAEKFKVSRNKTYKEYIPTYSNNAYRRSNFMGRDQEYYDAFGVDPMNYSCDTEEELTGACHDVTLPVILLPRNTQNRNKNNNTNPAFKHNIYKDRPLKEKQSPLIDHFRGRYKRNGHNITGIYCWIPDFGFYPLHVDFKKAEDALYNLCGKVFNNQNFSQVSMRYKIAKKGFIPFNAKDIINPEDHFFYFYDGIRVETKLDYHFVKENPHNRTYNTCQLSVCAMHPIMDDTEKNKHVMSQQVFYRGALANGVFSYLGCNKIYTFDNGNCIKIEPVARLKMLSLNDDKKDTTASSQAVFNKVNKDILANELENSKNDEKEKIQVEENAIKTIIFDSLFQVYHELEQTTQNLSVYAKNKLAVKCVKAMDSFVTDMEDIMEKDLQVELHEK